MSTFLFCQCDTVVTKMCRNFIPVVKETYETGTNCKDVIIVGIICATIFLLTLVVAWTVLTWKTRKIQAIEKEREFKKMKEKEDSVREQKADLLDKKLQFLQNLCYEVQERTEIQDNKEVKKMCKVLMKSNSKEVNQYLYELEEALKSYSQQSTTPNHEDER